MHRDGECGPQDYAEARRLLGLAAAQSDGAEAWLNSLRVCISDTVAMRHPRPMEHIACMLVDPSFQESLGLPTAEYVRRHDLEQRITNALGVAGFKAGDAVPSDMSSRLSAQLLADAKAPPAAAQVGVSDNFVRLLKVGREKLGSSPDEAEVEFEAAVEQARQMDNDAAMRMAEALTCLAKAKWRQGRYQDAEPLLTQAEELCERVGPCASAIYAEALGDHGVVLRHSDDIPKAAVILQKQYDLALQTDDKKSACRAIGNLGFSNFQLGNVPLAKKQLKERVDCAVELKHSLWECIGRSRLSIVYCSEGLYAEARQEAEHALKLSYGDETAVGLGHLHVARALLGLGKRDEALAHLDLRGFTPPEEGKRTPAMCLCKEPSAENAEYLSQIIMAGCDLTLTHAESVIRRKLNQLVACS